eukprot:6913250-Alexandrium_andersonii.AAC.1
MDCLAGQCGHSGRRHEGCWMEARRERLGQTHAGRSHAVVPSGTRIGSRPSTASATATAGHGHCPSGQCRS